MAMNDARGLKVSTHSARALEHYERAADLTVSYFLDPIAEVEAALAEDPDFVMAHCLKAALLVTSTEKAYLPMLGEAVTAIERLSSRATERERRHGAAARAWLEGDFDRSIRLYGDIVIDEPRDLLALQVAHVGDFFLGESQLLRDRIAQVLPHWDTTVPGYGYVLGMYAFGLEETALYSQAEDSGRQALQINPRDPWAVHAVAHVMEMQGRIRDGIEWLSSRTRDWAPNNGLAYHNWWHLALYNLDLGEHARALELFDGHIRPQPSQAALELIDATALLWRAKLRGIDVGNRWQSVADSWKAAACDGFYAFNDVHAAMASAAAGRDADVGQVLGDLRRAAEGRGSNAFVSATVGLPLAQGLVAFARGRYEEAIERLLPVRTIAHRFGGSHAQRDLVHLTLVEAALRAGRGKLSVALASERTHLRPTNPFNWVLAGRAYQLEGNESKAQQAVRHAETRRKAQWIAPSAAA